MQANFNLRVLAGLALYFVASKSTNPSFSTDLSGNLRVVSNGLCNSAVRDFSPRRVTTFIGRNHCSTSQQWSVCERYPNSRYVWCFVIEMDETKLNPPVAQGAGSDDGREETS
jgi:hypothetical protein